jgi:hypothetical protein
MEKYKSCYLNNTNGNIKGQNEERKNKERRSGISENFGVDILGLVMFILYGIRKPVGQNKIISSTHHSLRRKKKQKSYKTGVK